MQHPKVIQLSSHVDDEPDNGRVRVFPVISNVSFTITVTMNGGIFPLPF